MISLSQAFANWKEIAADLPEDDGTMLAESWNDYTDSLAKDGELCALQYHYAPAYDDPMPGEGSRFDPLADDRCFILDAMGIELGCLASTGSREGWDAGASHWKVVLTYNGTTTERFDYSIGSAHKGAPERDGVLNCLLRDAELGEGDFEDFCAETGSDEDSRKAYATWEDCQKIGAELSRLFSAPQLSDIRELFSEF